MGSLIEDLVEGHNFVVRSYVRLCVWKKVDGLDLRVNRNAKVITNAPHFNPTLLLTSLEFNLNQSSVF